MTLFDAPSNVPKGFRMLLATFAVFTLLDTVTTTVGLRVGCVELNPIVTMWGITMWALFRFLLLGSMMATFLASYRLCARHFQQGLRVLQTILIILNIFIIAIVSSGVLAIFSQLTG